MLRYKHFFIIMVLYKEHLVTLDWQRHRNKLNRLETNLSFSFTFIISVNDIRFLFLEVCRFYVSSRISRTTHSSATVFSHEQTVTCSNSANLDQQTSIANPIETDRAYRPV